MLTLVSHLACALHLSYCHLSDAIHWIPQHKYQVTYLVHYLDNFFSARAANGNDCETDLFSVCSKINIPIKASKIEGPSNSLTLLGIHFNMITMDASIIPQWKQALLLEFTDHQCCTKQVLLSFVSKLSFSCKVLPV